MTITLYEAMSATAKIVVVQTHPGCSAHRTHSTHYLDLSAEVISELDRKGPYSSPYVLWFKDDGEVDNYGDDEDFDNAFRDGLLYTRWYFKKNSSARAIINGFESVTEVTERRDHCFTIVCVLLQY